MKIEQVAVILFTLRDYLHTPEEVAETLKKVSDIGYRSVQVSGMKPDVISAKDLRKLCDDNGLSICATHEPPQSLVETPEKVVERLKTLGCRYTAWPSPGGYPLATADELGKYIDLLNAAGQVLRDHELSLLYHNHNNEFHKIDGKPILEHIYERTTPETLQGEPDVFWIQKGGACPIDWCHRLAGRLPAIHLKDAKVGEDRNLAFAEIGAGNLPFQGIVDAAEKSGCEWFIVEQDRCDGDPFDSISQSFNYICENLCE